MAKLILHVETSDEIEAEDWVAFGNALVADLENLEVGTTYAGKDSTGERRQWYSPKITVKSEVVSER